MKSAFTDKEITAAQWLTEAMCNRSYRAKYGKGDLGYKFWLTDEWAKEFKKQIVIVNRLLKKYPVSVIVAVLNNPRAKKVYSFGANFVLKPLLEEELHKFSLIKSVSPRSETNENSERPTQMVREAAPSEISLANKLKGL